MAKGGLRRFDVQAKWATVFSIAAALACLAVVYLLQRNWKWDIRQFVFSGTGLYQPIVIVACGVTMILAAFGAALGFNSAGQRRNDKQKLSWAGFFLGTGVLAVAFILFIAFFMLKLAV